MKVFSWGSLPGFGTICRIAKRNAGTTKGAPPKAIPPSMEVFWVCYPLSNSDGSGREAIQDKSLLSTSVAGRGYLGKTEDPLVLCGLIGPERLAGIPWPEAAGYEEELRVGWPLQPRARLEPAEVGWAIRSVEFHGADSVGSCLGRR